MWCVISSIFDLLFTHSFVGNLNPSRIGWNKHPGWQRELLGMYVYQWRNRITVTTFLRFFALPPAHNLSLQLVRIFPRQVDYRIACRASVPRLSVCI